MIAALQRPWPHVLAAGLVRLLVLLVVPYAAAQLAIPGLTERQDAAGSTYLNTLRWRVTVHALTEDEPAYDEMARNIAAGRGLVLDSVWLITTPGRPAMYAGFTYPVFVAAIYRVFGPGEHLPVFLIQILLASGAAYFVFETARRVAGPVAGALAATYYAFHPVLIWSSVALMSESLAIPLTVVLMWLLVCRPPVRGRAAVIGALMAGVSLARSTFAYFTPVAAWLLVLERRSWRGWSRRLASGCAVLAVFAACVAPWAVRNYVYSGRLIPFSTKSGTNAWMWNHPGLTVEFGPRAFEAPKPVDVFDAEIQNLPSEAERDARLMRLFLDFVAADPAKFAGLVFVRTVMALAPVAVSSGYHGGSVTASATAIYVKGIPLLALGAGLWFLRARFWWRIRPLVLFVAYWTAMQSLAGPGLRYRLPADPAWACIAGAVGAAALARLARSGRPNPLARRWIAPRRVAGSGI
jgi:4-amino-4-deoxy-L-arabinose transferase-like glycosyltransferase